MANVLFLELVPNALLALTCGEVTPIKLRVVYRCRRIQSRVFRHRFFHLSHVIYLRFYILLWLVSRKWVIQLWIFHKWVFNLWVVEIRFRNLTCPPFVNFELLVTALPRHGLDGRRRHDETVVPL